MGYQMIGGSTSPVWVPDAPVAKSQPPRYPTRGKLGADGLMHHEIADRTGRVITEFSLPDGRSKRDTWMNPYCLAPQLMIALDKNPSEAKTARRLEEYCARNSGAKR
jgi:hypothetical protein